MEIVVGSEHKDEGKSLMDKFRGTHRRYKNLVQGWLDNDPLEEILRLLEKSGDIYIERNPRLVNGVMRTNIGSSDIIYFDSFPSITRRTLLYRTKVEYGDYTINHILGCAHGCMYPCYAMNMSKRWGRVDDYEGWMHPRIVRNALNLLDQELPRLKNDIHFIHLSFMTDPFMFDSLNERDFPWIQNLTLSIIKRINEEKIKVTVLTKGIFPQLLTSDMFNKGNEYGITLVSLDDEFHSKYEPFSAPPSERIASLKELHDQGLKTWVSLEPYPTPNIVNQEISEILDEVSFVDKIIFGRWNYNALVNGHEEVSKFYSEQSDEVVHFAKEHNIPFHIKEGTPRSTPKTERIFHS
jgi:DNA repair photolyase